MKVVLYQSVSQRLYHEGCIMKVVSRRVKEGVS